MGWQWHCRQLDDMQTICTLIQTDNYASNSSLNFYKPDAIHDTQPTVSKVTADTNLYCSMNRGTCVWKTCLQLLQDNRMATDRNDNLMIASATPYLLCHHATQDHK